MQTAAQRRGRLQGVNQSLKEQRRRERVREYDAALGAAASALAVLALFVQAREARSRDESLEELFAAARPALDGGEALPAAIWVALRQNDTEAALDLLVSLSGRDFLIAEHEQVDGEFRLVTVEEKRALPELDRLQSQLAEALHVPVDVLAMLTGWGAEDPRTASEVEALLEHRFGAPAVGATPRPPAVVGIETEARSAGTADGGLTMSAREFGGLLNLSDEQRRVLATLVRQTTITIQAGDEPS